MTFKRNQVEEAIAGMRGSSAPNTELRTRIKRLLETDRRKGRSPRSADPERAQYAFYSTDARGSGVETWFSDYEAFALLTALRLLEHGWPQAGAVSIMRRARAALEPKHREILKRALLQGFDKAELLRPQLAGSHAVSVADPVFLAIASRGGRQKEPSPPAAREVRILGEEDLMRFCRSEVGLSVTCFELMGTAYALARALVTTSPSKRGPGSR